MRRLPRAVRGPPRIKERKWQQLGRRRVGERGASIHSTVTTGVRPRSAPCHFHGFRVRSILIILNSCPVFGSGPNMSRVLVFGPVVVSIWRRTAGFLVMGQL